MVRTTLGALVRRRTLLAVACVACVASAAITSNAQVVHTAQAQADSAPLSIVERETPWPRTVHAGATTLSVSQPAGRDVGRLRARRSLRREGDVGRSSPRTAYGVVSIDARTLTDKVSRTVVIDQANLVNAHFANVAKEESARWSAAIAADLATPSRLIALDRLETARRVRRHADHRLVGMPRRSIRRRRASSSRRWPPFSSMWTVSRSTSPSPTRVCPG